MNFDNFEIHATPTPNWYVVKAVIPKKQARFEGDSVPIANGKFKACLELVDDLNNGSLLLSLRFKHKHKELLVGGKVGVQWR